MNSDIIMQIFVMHKHVQPQDAQTDHKVEGPNKFLSFLKLASMRCFLFTLEDNRLNITFSVF